MPSVISLVYPSVIIVGNPLEILPEILHSISFWKFSTIPPWITIQIVFGISLGNPPILPKIFPHFSQDFSSSSKDFCSCTIHNFSLRFPMKYQIKFLAKLILGFLLGGLTLKFVLGFFLVVSEDFSSGPSRISIRLTSETTSGVLPRNSVRAGFIP